MVVKKKKISFKGINYKDKVIGFANITLTLLALNMMSQNMGLFDVFFMRVIAWLRLLLNPNQVPTFVL